MAKTKTKTKKKPELRVVMLSADWCQPCKSLKRQLTNAEIQFEVVDIDTKDGEKLADRLGVKGIPEVFLRRGRKYTLVEDATARRVKKALEEAAA